MSFRVLGEKFIETWFRVIPSPSRGGLGWGWVLQSAKATHPPSSLPLEGGGASRARALSAFWSLALLPFALLALPLHPAHAAPPQLSSVVPDKPLQFPRDFGAHPDFRTEWWYATGWLETPDGEPMGFQITFFRSATDHDRDNPSRFAPTQLIIAHAALSDPAVGKLLHAEKSAREGFGLAYAREGNTDVKLDDWTLTRDEQGRYHVRAPSRKFTLLLTLIPTQPPLLQGNRGYSRKGPKAEQASYYYSEPHLKVEGTVSRDGKPVKVTGSAWLDHEWSTTVLDERALGWDWIGVNLEDGAALTAFRIRAKDGSQLWAYAALRDKNGDLTVYAPDAVQFIPHRNWRSPRTEADYPVEMTVQVTDKEGKTQWRLLPLQDDQELDSRASTGAVYWEGAVTALRDGKPVGRGYLEMTGYVSPLEL
jgi:predicted secreted hydrolase